ncbi:hypothetical protein [Mesorhizobium abyssinicae]|uniref:hypothetical protein n=1 Tax=Mesorhizobium abyssinicae TaxID=1209958 RepID=UPI00339A3698
MRAELDRLAPAALKPKPFGYVYRVGSQPSDEWRFTRDAHLTESAKPGYYIIQPVYDAPAFVSLMASQHDAVRVSEPLRDPLVDHGAGHCITTTGASAALAAHSAPSESFFAALSDSPRTLPEIIEALTRLQTERRVR